MRFTSQNATSKPICIEIEIYVTKFRHQPFHGEKNINSPFIQRGVVLLEKLLKNKQLNYIIKLTMYMSVLF